MLVSTTSNNVFLFDFGHLICYIGAERDYDEADYSTMYSAVYNSRNSKSSPFRLLRCAHDLVLREAKPPRAELSLSYRRIVEARWLVSFIISPGRAVRGRRGRPTSERCRRYLLPAPLATASALPRLLSNPVNPEKSG